MQTGLLVVGTYREEADNMIEGHLHQMLRLKKLKREACREGKVTAKVKKEGYEFYEGNLRVLDKRCGETVGDAMQFVAVSEDKDFLHMFKEAEIKARRGGLGGVYKHLAVTDLRDFMWL